MFLTVKTALLWTHHGLLALVMILCLAHQTMAQQPEAVEQAEPEYVVSYALVLLGVGLGMFAICRMGKRSHKIGPG